MVDVEVENRSGAEVDADRAVALARQVLAGEGIDSGELGIAFVDRHDVRRQALAIAQRGRL